MVTWNASQVIALLSRPLFYELLRLSPLSSAPVALVIKAATTKFASALLDRAWTSAEMSLYMASTDSTGKNPFESLSINWKTLCTSSMNMAEFDISKSIA